MNAIDPPPGPEDSGPEIVLISFDRLQFYLVEGEAHLNQLLLADGVFPTPVLCVHFGSIPDAAKMIGETFDLSQYWGVHPDIVARLRETNCLRETQA